MPLILLWPMLGLGQGVPSPGDTSHDWLNHWSFSDTNAWSSDLGYSPLTFNNLSGSDLGDSLALVLDSPASAWLNYKINEDDGTTNLTVGTGSVLLWFASAWSSTNQGGTGPGQWGRLIEANYLDGVGRVIQVRDEAETNGYRVVDIFFNPLGQVLSQGYPVFSSGSSYAASTATRTNTYTVFDPIGRPYIFYPVASASLDNGALTGYPTPLSGDSGSPVGPVSLVFHDGSNPWAILVFNPLDKVHKYYLDDCSHPHLLSDHVGTAGPDGNLASQGADLCTAIGNAHSIRMTKIEANLHSF